MSDLFALELLQNLSGSVNARDAFVRLVDRCRGAARADAAAVLRPHAHRPGYELVLTLGLPVRGEFVYATTIERTAVVEPEISRAKESLLFEETRAAANLPLPGRPGTPVAVVHLEWKDAGSLALATLKDLKDSLLYVAPMVEHLQRYDSRISIQPGSAEVRPDEVDLELDMPEAAALFRRIHSFLSARVRIEGAAFALLEGEDLVVEPDARFGRPDPLPEVLPREKFRAVHEAVAAAKPAVSGRLGIVPFVFSQRGIGAAILTAAGRSFPEEDLARAAEALIPASIFVQKTLLHRQTKRANPNHPLLLVGVPRDVLELAGSYADAEAPILIAGESGTGKESAARFIHLSGPRRNAPFLPFNCAELVENLAESQLFGHAKGAFTGAVAETAGIFEQANGGTLFLDEIHLLTPPLQAKFLRAIEAGEIRPVGSTGPARRLDVRIVVATNRDLAKLVGEGSFLHDLYMRLDVLEVNLPPLRQNRHTILKIASALLVEISARNRKKIDAFTPRAKQALFLYDYPGNIRELKNILEKAVVITRGSCIDADALPRKMLSGKAVEEPVSPELFDTDYEAYKSAAERSYLAKLLERSGGNIAEAARLSGLHRTHIYNLMKKHSVRPERAKAPVGG